jgi:hypothetical protein
MKLFNKHISKKLALIIIAVFVISGTAIAAMLLSIPNTGIVLNGDIRLYSDSGCSTPLTAIAWGDIPAGSSVSKTVYIKNWGNNILNVDITFVNAPVGVTLSGDVEVLALGIASSGDERPVLLTLNATTETPAGSLPEDFSTEFTASIP